MADVNGAWEGLEHSTAETRHCRGEAPLQTEVLRIYRQMTSVAWPSVTCGFADMQAVTKPASHSWCGLLCRFGRFLASRTLGTVMGPLLLQRTLLLELVAASRHRWLRLLRDKEKAKRRSRAYHDTSETVQDTSSHSLAAVA